MSDTENLADLVITFAAVDTPALAAFTEMSAAGEEMVTAVTASATEVTTALTEMATEAEAAATAMTTAMTEATAPLAEVGAAAQKTAADVTEANARMAEVEKEWAAATDQAGAAVIAANERQAASFAALKDKVEADNAKMAAAQDAAVAANARVTAAKNGELASMGALSVASSKASASYSNFAGKLGMTGKQLTLLGAGAAAVAIGTTKMAADFESETQRLVSSAGEVESNLAGVRDGILKISSATGYSAKELSEGMYKIESGGQHGAAGLKVLQAAAEGARAENANMETVADAVTSALTDYHLKADDAATVTSKLVAATASGKMTFEELSRSLASVLPVASANHVSLNDILGDMASMTTHGMTAQRTTQNLADAIRHMAAPTQMQAKEFALLGTNVQQVQQNLGTKGLSGTIEDLTNRIQQKMGPQARAVVLQLGTALQGLDPKVQELGKQLMAGSINSQDFAMQLKGLPPILQGQASQFATLAKSTHAIGNAQMSGTQVMQTYSGAVRAAMGDATGMNVALMLTGENTKTTTGAINAVTGATTEAGNHVKGWAGIQATFNQKIKEAHASFSALAIEVGQVFLPVASKLLGWFATGAKFFAQHKGLAIALAAVIGGVLVLAIVGMVVAMYSFAASLMAVTVAGAPLWIIILAVIAAVALLAAGAYLIVHNWGHIKAFFLDLWHRTEQSFKDAWNGIKSAFTAVVHFFENAGHLIAEPFEKGWKLIKSIFEMSPKEIGEKVGQAIGAYVRWVAHFWTSLWHDAVAAFHAVVNAAKAFGKDVVKGAEAALNWLMSTPKKIRDLFKDAGSWLLHAAEDMWNGYIGALKKFWTTVWNWIVNLPQEVKDLWKDAKDWLKNTGKNLWDGLIGGLKSAWHSVTSAISGFVKGLIDGFKKGLGIASPSTIFHSIGIDILNGLLNGLKSLWNTVNSWFGGIPGKILGFFSNGFNLLENAGENIMSSLYNGLVNVWGKVQSFVGGIGDWISSHKGPVEVDRVLLTPHGKAIMQGLHDGMQAGNAAVQAFVTSVPAQITSKLSGAADGAHAAGQSYAAKLAAGIRDSQHLAVKAAQDMADGVHGVSPVQAKPGALAAGYAGYAYAGALTATTAAPGQGGGDTHIHLNIAGSVWTTKNLVTEVQQELTRVGMRNTTNGTNYLGFNRSSTAAVGR